MVYNICFITVSQLFVKATQEMPMHHKGMLNELMKLILTSDSKESEVGVGR